MTSFGGSSRDLEEELYCPICADLFEDPMMLSCTHSFCKRCLEERITKGNITRRSSIVIFDCPVCRKDIELEDGLCSLPRNRLLKKMVDVFRTQADAKVQLETAQAQTTTKEQCTEHDKELGAFCSACRQTVCIDCIVGKHRGHPIDSIEDVYHKRKKVLERRSEELEDELKALVQAKHVESEYRQQLMEHCKQKTQTIQAQFDEYIALLRQTKDSILVEIESRERKEVARVQQTMDNIEAREHVLKLQLDQLKDKIHLDKMQLLKEAELKRSTRLSQSTSSLSSDSGLGDSMRSPRTRCFLDCTLNLDGAALESAINNAHLIWEPDADMNSPKHLADKLNQLYEKEWKAAYLESSLKNKDEVVTQLLNVFLDAYRHAKLCSENHLESLTYHLLQPDIDVQLGEFNIHGYNMIEPDNTESTTFCGVKEGLRKLRANYAADCIQNTVFMIQNEAPQMSASSGNHRQMSAYTSKCFEVAYALMLQDPPMHVHVKEDTEAINDINKELYRIVRRKGRKTKTVAWPPLYLYKGGPLLSKGVVFVPH